MAISGVNPKCFILALFVRDDGARFLLGDDPYEFKDKQLHFQQNTIANDVVEVQGNDGYLLAGQVRRPGSQMFDGYVCNGTNSKEEVEVKRRAFLQFFRRSHFYKVIYVFPNGTAIQRKQGFLVDDPTVQELYQQYPEYHVALNFEDVNYYTYEEDDQGHEIYAKEAIVALARGGATGGLIWDSYGVVWEDAWSLPLSISGVQFQILNNAGARAPIDNVELYGDTYQQTYSGKNLFSTSVIIGGWAASGSAINSGSRFKSQHKIIVSPQTTYTFSGISKDVSKTLNIAIQNYDSNETIISQLPSSTTLADVPFTFTTPANCTKITFSGRYSDNTNFGTVGQPTDAIQEVQIEQGTTPTSYEPYTGGIPAPNPDYPETVNVVTGEQTVEVTGKNLFDKVAEVATSPNYSLNPDGTITTNASNAQTGRRYMTLTMSPGTYTLSFRPYFSGVENPAIRFTIRNMDTSTDYIVKNINNPENGALQVNSFTVENTTSVGFCIIPQARLVDGQTFYFYDTQLEQGSTATTYEPYQSQTYTIDLGATELCKIDDYQDYIYKSGDDWYVHKEFGKYIFNGTETIAYNSSNKGFTINPTNLANYMPNHATPPMVGLSTHFSVNSTTSTWTGDNRIGLSSSGTFWCKATSFATSQSDCLTWLSANKPSVYYALATASDTKITDATLVGQLEALGAMKLFIGENNVLVSATNPNLPATLAFDYYTNFAAIGAEWEEGGTKGATIVNVDAIDNTYPVWELIGPATNPTLSVLTTNTTLTYNGTITASQKLVIDMFNKTATLNGTSVIGNISGDFVYMAPGTNRLAYTAGNTDAPDSTIYWQEVVG